MTSDPKVAAVIRKGCPKCGLHNIDPTMAHRAECIDKPEHVHMICDNADCLHTWEAQLA